MEAVGLLSETRATVSNRDLEAAHTLAVLEDQNGDLAGADGLAYDFEQQHCHTGGHQANASASIWKAISFAWTLNWGVPDFSAGTARLRARRAARLACQSRYFGIGTELGGSAGADADHLSGPASFDFVAQSSAGICLIWA
jgi:hypothetical protein